MNGGAFCIIKFLFWKRHHDFMCEYKWCVFVCVFTCNFNMILSTVI